MVCTLSKKNKLPTLVISTYFFNEKLYNKQKMATGFNNWSLQIPETFLSAVLYKIKAEEIVMETKQI